MSLNVVTRRHRTRMWPQAMAAVLVLAGIAGWVVDRSTAASPSAAVAGAAQGGAGPYTRPELDAALLTPHEAGRGYHVDTPVHRMGDIPTSTGCVQLDGVVQSMRSPAQPDAYRNLSFQGALPALQEQIDSEAAAAMSVDFATAVAALGTCRHIGYELAPGKRLTMSMRAIPVRVKGVEAVGRRLDGTVGAFRLRGFLGFAKATPSSVVIFLYLDPLGPGDGGRPAVTLFDRAIRKAEHSLTGFMAAK